MTRLLTLTLAVLAGNPFAAGAEAVMAEHEAQLVGLRTLAQERR